MTEDPTVRERPAAGVDSPGDVPWMIDRFVIEEELGAGGMGRVYAAYDPSLDRRVAVKVMRDDFGLDAARGPVRMAREARAMARLQHPNVATVHEVGTHEGRVFIVMEYVAGGTLRGWLKQRPELTWQAIVEMYVQAGRGLAAAHRAGIVHRDFKPDNVLVDEGRVLVTDFGIANVYADARDPGDSVDVPIDRSRTGGMAGTPPYMSPEQHRSEPSDARTDQFSFCVALYEALYGVRPFAGEEHASIADAAIHGDITPPVIDRDVPLRIAAAVRRGLASEPAARFRDMPALLAELEPPPPRRRRWPWLAGAAAVIAAVVIVLAIWPAVEPPAFVCDCERVTFAPPANGRVVGFGSPIVPVSTNVMAVPRGPFVVAYAVDGVTYSYAIASRGIDHERTIALPAPDRRDGYAFVPGGEVPIGDTTVHLEPYLIAVREESELATFAAALAIARTAHARLPSAAEWEWAARLGLLDRALSNQWEWTVTAFGPPPYDDERDDPFATAATVEVRGGQTERCEVGRDRRAGPCGADDPDDRALITRRLEGSRSGLAEVRLARTPVNAVPPTELVVMPDRRGLGRFHRFLWDWLADDSRKALQIARRDGPGCTFEPALDAVLDQVEIIEDPALEREQTVLRMHPEPSYRGHARRVTCTDASIEIVDPLCFDGASPTPRSTALIDAVVSTLDGNPALEVLDIVVHVPHGTPDAEALARRRADTVRARMLAAGIAPGRLLAHGGGESKPEDEAERGRRELLRPRTASACTAGDQTDFIVVKRAD
ncbi:MAG: protein kinase [Kofleriaceae bacterium]